MDGVEIVRRMAQNNAWANHRLHREIGHLAPAEYRAARTSFFPSLHLTLNHILWVDEYYVDALAGSPRPAAALWAEHDRFAREAGFAEIAAAQRACDRRLIDHLAGLAGPAVLEEVVELERKDHVQRERRGDVLLHLFQHQIHHRGQAHAMLSATGVKPPQLDEFFLAEELPLRAAELAELGLPRR
jgi:uncharacterized damage-inducible protein DinB